jgi:hypothetical protein
MAALAADFHGWKVVRGHPYFESNQRGDGADVFYRGAIATTATGDGQVKVTNGVTTDNSIGIVSAQTTVASANDPVLIISRGILWFTGVAAIAIASNHELLYPLLTSDNPADLTATAAGNCGALGRILEVEVTAVSGYVDISDRSVVSNVA